ncbi:hypothetical protein [Spiroplasma endosymbiont of Aspidapion aeneum]|uniref:hypothetical protein n=1 Tax=Spiroplasma endosymbiont of Aspidapion aeneum TaxID=3066276 RepID=UPI00313C0A6D
MATIVLISCTNKEPTLTSLITKISPEPDGNEIDKISGPGVPFESNLASSLISMVASGK